MRYDLSADQRLLQSTTSSFLEKAGGLGAVRALNELGDRVDRNVWRRGSELGWTSLLVPERAGGGSISGEGVVDATILAEVFGRYCFSGPFTAVNVVASALGEAATASQHEVIIDDLLAGTAVAAWSVDTSADCGTPGAGSVTARVDGDEWVVDGRHDGVEYGAEADVLLVLCNTDDGPTQLLVPRDSVGLSVTPLESLDMVRGFAHVTYDGVRVPANAIVGVAGDAGSAAERQFQLAVVLQCAETVGVVERVLDFTRQWMFDRFSFGRPLASYQALKHRMADMTLWSEAAQATMAAAADAVQQDRANAPELVSIAKSYIGQRATDIIQDCVQMHGGIGVTWEHDIHIFLRRATVGRVTWGTPSAHRRRIADLLNV